MRRRNRDPQHTEEIRWWSDVDEIKWFRPRGGLLELRKLDNDAAGPCRGDGAHWGTGGTEVSSVRKEAFGIAVVGAAALLMVGLAKGHGPATPGQTATVNVDTAPPIRSTTRLVQVSVIVTDKKGEPVSGLSKQDFAVLDEGKTQEIAFFSAEAPRVRRHWVP